jgi:hypothetical protein
LKFKKVKGFEFLKMIVFALVARPVAQKLATKECKATFLCLSAGRYCVLNL